MNTMKCKRFKGWGPSEVVHLRESTYSAALRSSHERPPRFLDSDDERTFVLVLNVGQWREDLGVYAFSEVMLAEYEECEVRTL
jgi:hypothetical protein